MFVLGQSNPYWEKFPLLNHAMRIGAPRSWSLMAQLVGRATRQTVMGS